jgi:hypothetical protein
LDFLFKVNRDLLSIEGKYFNAKAFKTTLRDIFIPEINGFLDVMKSQNYNEEAMDSILIQLFFDFKSLAQIFDFKGQFSELLNWIESKVDPINFKLALPAIQSIIEKQNEKYSLLFASAMHVCETASVNLKKSAEVDSSFLLSVRFGSPMVREVPIPISLYPTKNDSSEHKEPVSNVRELERKFLSSERLRELHRSAAKDSERGGSGWLFGVGDEVFRRIKQNLPGTQ